MYGYAFSEQGQLLYTYGNKKKASLEIMSLKFANFLIDPIMRSSWRAVVLLWKPMAYWTLVVYAFFSSLIIPISVAFLNFGMFRGDQMIAGNEELISWFLSPAGLFYLFTIALLIMTGVVVRYAGFYQIISDDLRGEPISVKVIALHIAQRIHILMKLCAFTMIATAIALIPLLAGLYLCYSIWLSGFDINYYISTTPPEWYRALIAGGIWGGTWLLGVLAVVSWTLPALPAYLDGNKTIRESLQESWSVSYTQMLRFLKMIGVVLLFWFVIRVMSDAILLTIFGTIAETMHSHFDSLRMIAVVTAAYIIFALFIGTVISFIGFSLLSAIVTKFYFKDSPENVNIVVPGFQSLIRKTFAIFGWWFTPLRMAVLILTVTAGSLAVSFFLIGESSDQSDVQIIAHRANAMGAPENSIAALDNTISLGADMAEIDVQLTRDGNVIVHHDADFMRSAGDPRRLSDVSFDEIASLRMHSNLDLPESMLRIPTLGDFLNMSRGNIVLMIELKYYGFNSELAEKVIELIRDHEMEEQVLLMSLSLEAVQQLRELAPDMKIGYVSAAAAGDLTRLNVDFLAVSQQSITPRLISNSKNRGIPVFAWTVNDSGDMIDAIQTGVNGLITDEPEQAIHISAEMAGLTMAERLLLRFGFVLSVK